jgi:hypothetical protein
VSTDAGTSPEGNGRAPEAPTPRRGLRDHPLGKLLLLAAVLGIAVVSTRTCGSSQREIDAEEAVEIARAEASFEPCPDQRCRQRRVVPRGIPPRQYWAVVLAPALDANGLPTRTESFLVDATTGEVSRVG